MLSSLILTFDTTPMGIPDGYIALYPEHTTLSPTFTATCLGTYKISAFSGSRPFHLTVQRVLVVFNKADVRTSGCKIEVIVAKFADADLTFPKFTNRTRL